MSYSSTSQRSLYHLAPFWLKNLIASGYGVQQRRARYGGDYRRWMALLQDSQRWSADRLMEYRNAQAHAFVNAAIRRIPYYANRKEYAPIPAASDLSGLPVLSKESVRAHLETLYGPSAMQQGCRWGHTSGTSGKSLIFPITLSCFRREYAFRALHYSWGGVDVTGRDRVAFCSGHPVAAPDRRRPPFWTHDRANNWLLFSSYHMSAATLAHYVRKLESFQPVMLGGYPSSLYLLALAYRSHGRVPLRLRSVFTASETLFDFQRQAIREAFGVPVFNWYGNSEMCANIVECEEGELHLKLEHSYVEILNDANRPCVPGETGRLVCTGFGNPAFPLIRYDIGDEVTVARNQTPRCGRGGVLLERIQGRVEDYVVTPDGRLVGRLDHLFKDSRHVAEAQIVQREKSGIVIRLVRTPEYGDGDERAIRSEAHLRLGAATRVSFEYVPEIPRGKNGKFRFIESLLNQRALVEPLGHGDQKRE